LFGEKKISVKKPYSIAFRSRLQQGSFSRPSMVFLMAENQGKCEAGEELARVLKSEAMRTGKTG